MVKRKKNTLRKTGVNKGVTPSLSHTSINCTSQGKYEASKTDFAST